MDFEARDYLDKLYWRRARRIVMNFEKLVRCDEIREFSPSEEFKEARQKLIQKIYDLIR